MSTYKETTHAASPGDEYETSGSLNIPSKSNSLSMFRVSSQESPLWNISKMKQTYILCGICNQVDSGGIHQMWDL